MVLSGFLMAYTMTERADREPPEQWTTCLKFYIRRLFRIAPVYYAVLAVAVITAPYFLDGYARLENLHPEAWQPGGTYDPHRIDYSGVNLLLHLSFLFGLHPDYSFSTMLPDWSLSLEVQFYAVFPLILVASRRFGILSTAAVLWLASRASVKLYSVLVGNGTIEASPELSLLILKLPIFLIGLLLFEFATNKKKPVRVIALLLGLSISLYENRLYGSQWFILFVCVAIMAYLLMPETTGRTDAGILRRFLDNRVTFFMSEVAYSVYLIQGLALSFVGALIAEWSAARFGSDRLVTFFAVLTTVTFVTYSLSWLSFKAIEGPGIKLGKQIAAQKIAQCGGADEVIE